MGPAWEKITNQKMKSKMENGKGVKRCREFKIFLSFYVSNLSSQIHENLTIGINTKSALLDEGYT